MAPIPGSLFALSSMCIVIATKASVTQLMRNTTDKPQLCYQIIVAVKNVATV